VLADCSVYPHRALLELVRQPPRDTDEVVRA